MASASDSEQDSTGSCSAAQENSFSPPRTSGQPSASRGGQHASDYTAAAAAQMQYMQQQQMMMTPGNYLPFMMPPAYQMMMQQQGSSPQSPYGKNSTREPDSIGSPLNLQTTRNERPSSRPRDHLNQNMVPGQFSSDQVLHPAHSNPHTNLPSASRGSPQVAGLHSSLPNTLSSMGAMAPPQNQMSLSRFSGDFSLMRSQQQHHQQESAKPEPPPPPKRPLTPYMRFSKCMWQQVKATNPGLSVCEIGATIGRMWRELSNEEKQRHNDDFTLDKVRYDTELKQYLKSTGLRARDLVKIRAKNKAAAKAAARRPPAPPQQQQQSRPLATTSLDAQQLSNPQLGQPFMGLPIAGMGASLPMGVGMPMGMLPGFPQMWATAGQQYPSQQMLASMQLAQQQAQGLYNNGAVPSDSVAVSSVAQLTPGGDGHAPSMYLYSQNFM